MGQRDTFNARDKSRVSGPKFDFRLLAFVNVEPVGAQVIRNLADVRSIGVEQHLVNDLTLAIEPDSLRCVSSTDGVSSSLLPVLFEVAISFILTFALNIAPRQQPRAHVSLRVLAH